MARELTINNLSDYVFDSGTTIFVNGSKVYENTSTPLTISLENFLLKEDEERIKIDITNYANEFISENILNSVSFRENIEAFIEEEITLHVASESNPGSVCVFTTYTDNNTGVTGDNIPIVYSVEYINDTFSSFETNFNKQIKTLEQNFTTKSSALSSEIENIKTSLTTANSNISSNTSSIININASLSLINKTITENESNNKLNHKILESTITTLEGKIAEGKVDSFVDDAGRIYTNFETAFFLAAKKLNVVGLNDASIKDTLESISNSVTNINKDVSKLFSDVSTLNTSHDEHYQETKEILEQNRSECETEHRRINENVAAVTKKISDVECDYVGLQSEIAATKRELETLRSIVNSLNTEYQGLAQLSAAIQQNGLPMFADYFVESMTDASSAPFSDAQYIYLKVPSPAGTRYYRINTLIEDTILLENSN